MKYLVLFLEEASARAVFEGLLPRILPKEVLVYYVVFEGKTDMEKQIVKRLRGWIYPETAFVILRDQDSGDCSEIKHSLKEKCREAGKPETIVRIACRELESWYFGELDAVEKALAVNNLSKYAKSSKYRIPDQITKPSVELIKITDKKYQKISGSRKIGKHLSIETKKNTSLSYKHFISGLRKALKSLCK